MHDITVSSLQFVRVVPIAKVLDCGLEVNESEIQSRFYVHFPTNTLRKGIEVSYVPSAMGQIVSQLFFYKDGFGIK